MRIVASLALLLLLAVQLPGAVGHDVHGVLISIVRPQLNHAHTARSPLRTAHLPPSCPQAASLVVYGDSTTWQDWSWDSTVNLAATSPVRSGTNSISVSFAVSGGTLSLRSGASVDPTLYTTISFWVYGPTTSFTFFLSLDDGSTVVSSPRSFTIPANTWTQYTYNLQTIVATRPFSRINIQQAGYRPEGSLPSGPVFFDDIVLREFLIVPISASLVVYGDSTTWQDWSRDSTVNLAATSPVRSGTNSISVSFRSGGTLSLKSSAVDPTIRSTISFWANGPASSFSLFLSLDDGSVVSSRQSFTIPANTWAQFTYNLQTIGATRPFTRINLQQTGVLPSGPVFFDDIALTAPPVVPISGAVSVNTTAPGIAIDPRILGSNMGTWVRADGLANPSFRARARASGATVYRLPGMSV
jgi:hypothetical protein